MTDHPFSMAAAADLAFGMDDDPARTEPSTPADDVRFAATTIRAAVRLLRRQVAAAPQEFAAWPLEQEGFRARREAEAVADRLDRLAARMEAAR